MGAFLGLDRGIFMERCPRFVFWGQGGLSRGPESPESGENGVLGPAEVGSGRPNMFRNAREVPCPMGTCPGLDGAFSGKLIFTPGAPAGRPALSPPTPVDGAGVL